MKTLTKEEMRRHIQHMINKHGLVTSQCDRPSQAWASRELEEICRICRKLYGTDAWAMITGNGSGRAAR